MLSIHFWLPGQIYNVAKNPYGGYPTSLLAWGWTLLAICIATIFITLWKRDPSKLPPIEDDPRFQEVLGKHIELASDEEDNDEEAIPEDDDEEKVETSIDEPEVQVLPEAENEPTDEVLPDESIELEAPLVVAE